MFEPWLLLSLLLHTPQSYSSPWYSGWHRKEVGLLDSILHSWGSRALTPTLSCSPMGEIIGQEGLLAPSSATWERDDVSIVNCSLILFNGYNFGCFHSMCRNFSADSWTSTEVLFSLNNCQKQCLLRGQNGRNFSVILLSNFLFTFFPQCTK